METTETITFKDGAKLEIIQDDDHDSPREWDNNGTMVCFHNRYNLGDKHDYDESDVPGRDWDKLYTAIREDHDVAVICPLFLYDHSGLAISLEPFSCRWDSGPVGFIFASRENLKRGGHPDDVDLEKVKTWLRGEVETYNQYLNGDVYGFVLKTPTKCDACGHTEWAEVDSCWGFYGSNPAENGMIDHLSKAHRQELQEM